MRKTHKRVATMLRVERTETPGEPSRGRGIAWQLYGLVSGRLPGTSRGVAVLWAGCIRRTEQTRWAKPCVGLFPGAACCLPIELPSCKAACCTSGPVTARALSLLGLRIGV